MGVWRELGGIAVGAALALVVAGMLDDGNRLVVLKATYYTDQAGLISTRTERTTTQFRYVNEGVTAIARSQPDLIELCEHLTIGHEVFVEDDEYDSVRDCQIVFESDRWGDLDGRLRGQVQRANPENES